MGQLHQRDRALLDIGGIEHRESLRFSRARQTTASSSRRPQWHRRAGNEHGFRDGVAGGSK